MNKEEFKQLINEYLKENLCIRLADDSYGGNCTDSIRLVVELEGEEICYSYADIKHSEPRISY